MNQQLLRCTLGNSVLGSLVVGEPLEWKETPIRLERHAEYHCVLEYYDQPLTFWGEAIPYLQAAGALGIDIDVTFLMEISTDGGNTWETFFNGLIDISTKNESEEPTPLKAQYGIKRNDLWSKFINRKGTAIDLQSPNDLDLNPRVVINPITVGLPTQIIPKIFSGQLEQSYGFYSPEIPLNELIQIDYDKVVLDEIDKRQIIGNGRYSSIDDVQYEFLPIENNDDRLFDLIFNTMFEASVVDNVLDATTGIETRSFNYADPYIDFYIQVNDAVPVLFNANQYGPTTGRYSDRFYNTNTFQVKRGDKIKIYAKVKLALHSSDSTHYSHLVFFGTTLNAKFWDVAIVPTGGSPAFAYAFAAPGSDMFVKNIGAPPSGTAIPTSQYVTAQTKFADSDCKAFLLHESTQIILDRTIGMDDSLYAPVLGSPITQRVSYPDIGCFSKYATTKGLNIRGFSLSDKPISESFDEHWQGINPIGNFGLGPEIIDGTERIVIKPASEFYNSSTNSVVLKFVNGIKRSFNTDLAYSSIKFGFSKWKSETLASIDDPQTNQERATPLKYIGKTFSILSGWIGASLAWEFTRRESVNKSQSWTLDDDMFVIQTELQDVHPWVFINHYLIGEYVYVTVGLDKNRYRARTDNVNQDPLTNPNDWLFIGTEEIYLPELKINGSFPTTTGLLNPNTRYNKTLTPLRSFLRWINTFNVCIQEYVYPGTVVWSYGTGFVAGDKSKILFGSVYRYYQAKVDNINQPPNASPTYWKLIPSAYTFQKGEGNFVFSCDIVTDSCPGTDIELTIENGDVTITTDKIKGIEKVNFTHPLEYEDYKTIRSLKDNTIGVTVTDEDEESYVLELLKFFPYLRKAEFTLTKKV